MAAADARRGPAAAQAQPAAGHGARVPDLRRALQDAHRGEPLARLRRAGRRHGAAAARVPEVPHPVVDRQERRGPRHQGDDDPQSRHRRRGDQGRDVHRGQRPRQRDPGRRGVPLHDLVPDGALRPAAAHQAAGRRARVLHRADGEPRRPRALPAGALGRPLRPPAGRHRQRRRRRRGRRRRPERQRRHRADAALRAGAGHAPHQRPRSAAAGAGPARDQGRLRHPRLRGPRQRRRRPGERGRAGRLRSQPQLARGLAAELRAERLDGLSVPAARSPRGGALPAVEAQRRRRAVVPQLRRHDPARSRRRGAGRVSGAGRRASTTSSAGPASGCCRTTATW